MCHRGAVLKALSVGSPSMAPGSGWNSKVAATCAFAAVVSAGSRLGEGGRNQEDRDLQQQGELCVRVRGNGSGGRDLADIAYGDSARALLGEGQGSEVHSGIFLRPAATAMKGC